MYAVAIECDNCLIIAPSAFYRDLKTTIPAVKPNLGNLVVNRQFFDVANGWGYGMLLRVSISQADFVELQNGASYERNNNVVIINVYNITYSGNPRRLDTMPVGLRPTRTRYGVVNSDNNAGIVYVHANGNIELWAGANGTYTGQVVYCV